MFCFFELSLIIGQPALFEYLWLISWCGSLVAVPLSSRASDSADSSDMADQGDAGIPFIGSQISLISKSGIRYEGVLHTINMEESSIALQSGV